MNGLTVREGQRRAVEEKEHAERRDQRRHAEPNGDEPVEQSDQPRARRARAESQVRTARRACEKK